MYKLKRILFVPFVVGLITATSAYAGQLDDAFDEFGAYGNVTGPSAYEGQVNNYYTGGSLYMRAPNRTYQLVNISPPRFRAGCGGIDAYLGAFSHINLDGFVSMLRNIGQNALGLAFQVAIDVLEPLLGVNLKDLAAKINQINQTNIDSCQTAKALVGTVRDKYKEETQQWLTEWRTNWNQVTDWAQGKDQRGDGSLLGPAQVTAQGDPDAKQASPIVGNLVWRALTDQGNTTPAERILLMNLVGSLVVTPSGDDNNPFNIEYKPGRLTFQKLLLGEVTGATPNPTTLGTVPILLCSEFDTDGGTSPVSPDACTTLNPGTMADLGEFGGNEPYLTKVRRILDNMVTAIQAGKPQPPEAISLTGISSLPIYRMVAVAASVPGGSNYFIGKYAEAVAIDITASQMERMVATIKLALQKQFYKTSATNAEHIKQFLASANEIGAEIARKRMETRTGLDAVGAAAQEIALTEKKLFSNMSPMLRANIDYTR